MVKHNNVIPNAHFHKDWQNRVRCWFNQAPKKQARRMRREKKARAIFPRPVNGALRPVVRPPTSKYNTKLRLGRGFTLEELKQAGIGRQYAQTIGIAVDHRRHNKCEASLALNVQRLKEYQSKVVLFPRNKKKPKAGDASAADLKQVTQLTQEIMPLKKAAPALETRKITDEERKQSAFYTLRQARAEARLVGYRQVQKAKKEEAKKMK
mmetsp:Transcript_3933/g.10917  ORF Transcript_3933/g.10917 Transcript_3933/m.10917 type:complete len:209 (+) Transcript_3933:118-744(+)|eukprot:CAMPEP_0119118406 /NCGR_PEP_ID=MMETSP1310-20130426/298_1 /TAXON_ID=464262 /ORGANISM="Genus nov. species nov., Strain RCC2339" /LENGTH=208 /DNA_ID=CAMNT_0007107769 /DNA_START=122 /DNA_END=748 /DNA_ORIENTATION=-